MPKKVVISFFCILLSLTTLLSLPHHDGIFTQSLFNAERQSMEAVNTNFCSLWFDPLGIRPRARVVCLGEHKKVWGAQKYIRGWRPAPLRLLSCKKVWGAQKYIWGWRPTPLRLLFFRAQFLLGGTFLVWGAQAVLRAGAWPRNSPPRGPGPAGNQTQVYGFSSKPSIHSITDRLYVISI